MRHAALQSAPSRTAVVNTAAYAQAAFADQKLIRTAESNIEVDSVELAIKRVDSLARVRNAFVADVSHSNDGRAAVARLVIRVPVAQFTALLSSLAELGSVKNQSVSTEDVTKEYADLETRLAVKEQTVSRLRSLLATRTGQLDDVLNVERELARVVTELEQLKGERNYYDQRVATSTISVTFFESTGVTRTGFSPEVGTSFGNSIRLMVTVASWAVSLITFLLPWLAVAALGWFAVKRFNLLRRAM